MSKIEKINLSIGTPVVVATRRGIAYDGYYLGNGVVGYMNLPYRTNELFYIPFLNIYNEHVVGVCPFNMVEIDKKESYDEYPWTTYFPKKEFGTWADFKPDKVVDTDDFENCLYARDKQPWWNDEQKAAIEYFEK